jgi:hypothetical protein
VGGEGPDAHVRRAELLGGRGSVEAQQALGGGQAADAWLPQV